MLHELLFALSGHVGGLFIEREGAIKVGRNPQVLSVSFLHPGEESLLNSICEHGTYYLQFKRFIDKYIDFKDDTDIPVGLYMNTLCYSLQEEVLHGYESCLVELEEEIMMDCEIPLTYIQNKLSPFTLLFPSLSQLLIEIEKKKTRGCQLLSLVNKHSISGIPAVKEAMNKLLFSLHRVMYKQLSNWLIYGSLMDSYGEFFVHKVKRAKSLMSTTSNNQDDELGIGGISGDQLRQLQRSGDVTAANTSQNESAASDCYEQYSLRVEMLPNYLPTRVLHKIVFIGESVDMFENNFSMDAKKSILKHKASVFCKDLYMLSEANTFHVLDFENVIDRIRTEVTERLWEFVVMESDLYNVLQNVKSFFLMGRGDLYQALIDASDSLLSCPPTQMTTHDANRIFQQVLRSMNMNDEKYQNFRLQVEPSPKSTSSQSKSKQNGWQVLGIDYRAEWPLHVFFTSVALERYNKIFKFLLSVKRVHVALHKAWKQMMTRWSDHVLASETQSQGQNLIYQLRNHMQFLVDNLQTYLQVDVIESLFNEMMERIKESKDFEIIRTTHETFQTGLLAQCFLLNVPVNHCLNCILESCTSFCALVNSCDGSMTVDQLEHCQSLQTMFQKQTLLLFKILTNTKTHSRNPHLVQLLLRIDYNKYFSSAGQQLG